MGALALKLVLTPALIGATTLVARRWGQAVGGMVVALPLTSGPVLLFVALDQGHGFAAATAAGALGGAGAEVAFCLVYLATAGRGPVAAVTAASAAYATAGALVRVLPLGPGLPLPLLALVGSVTATIAGGLVVLRKRARWARAEPVLPPRWDVPLRMLAGTAIVLAITAVAPVLGPRLSGVVATYPLLTAILAVFAHRLEGPWAALEALRGLLIGLFALVAFQFALAALLPPLGLAAFAVAIPAALGLQAASLRFARRI